MARALQTSPEDQERNAAARAEQAAAIGRLLDSLEDLFDARSGIDSAFREIERQERVIGRDNPALLGLGRPPVEVAFNTEAVDRAAHADTLRRQHRAIEAKLTEAWKRFTVAVKPFNVVLPGGPPSTHGGYFRQVLRSAGCAVPNRQAKHRGRAS